jgi:hypothetical protein
MTILLAPILAQLITLGVAERTEGRLTLVDDERRIEGSTAPSAGIAVDWRKVGVEAGYRPLFTLRRRNAEDTDFVVEHAAVLGVRYRERFRHTLFTLSEFASYAHQNLRDDLLAPRPAPIPQNTPNTGEPAPGQNPPSTGEPDPTSPEPDAGAPSQNAAALRALDRMVSLFVLTSTAQVDHVLSPVAVIGGNLVHTLTTGTDRETRRDYPLVTTESGSVFGGHAFNRRNRVAATLVITHAATPSGTNSWVAQANAAFDHRFAPRTTGTVGAGISGSHTHEPSGLGVASIYPTFTAGIVHAARFRRGALELHLNATSAPFLDVTTARVDPRVQITAGLGWGYDEFSVTANGTTALSLEDDADAFSSLSADLTLAYALGAGFSADAGVRTAWQRFGETTLVPPSWAAFVGISWAAAVPLKRNR